MVRRGGGGTQAVVLFTNWHHKLLLHVGTLSISVLSKCSTWFWVTKCNHKVTNLGSKLFIDILAEFLSIKAHNGVRIVLLYFLISIIACVFILIITISIPLCHLGFGLWVKTKGNNKLLTAVNPSLVPLVLAHASPGKHGRKMVSIWWCTLSGRE